MKTNYIKAGILLVAVTAITISAKAQTSDSLKSGSDTYGSNNFHYVERTKSGQRVDNIRTNWHDRIYEMTLVNKQMTELYVDGEKIPQANWGKYTTVIAQIREQIRKDEIQAAKDQAQAKLDQQQAMRDQAQARIDQQQAERDQEQAKKDQEQAVREQADAKNDQAQAERDREQAKLDQAQALKDQEQARLDQIQAKKDQEEARKDQELMKQLIADLISDKIVPNEKSLHEMTLNPDEMTVNGVKQPEAVFKKYKEKYKRFSGGEFSYGNTGSTYGIHMSRHSVGDN